MTIHDVYALAGVENIRDLNRIYDVEDQRLMKSGQWDYDNPELLINRIKEALEKVDCLYLDSEEKEWRREILWFWYHHAVSCAIWTKKDKEAARKYAAMALLRQGGDHPNKITKLLYLLVHDRFEEAVEWATGIIDEVEIETATSLLAEYRTEKFF